MIHTIKLTYSEAIKGAEEEIEELGDCNDSRNKWEYNKLTDYIKSLRARMEETGAILDDNVKG